VPQTDAAEIARLLGPFAEAVGGALAVFGVDGSEIVSVGDGPLGDASAPVAVRAVPIGTVRASTQATARGAARLLSEVLGRRRALEGELESMATELLDRYEEVTLLHGLARARLRLRDQPHV